jgi:uncharacterized ion transporter superfamily protein YfcC
MVYNCPPELGDLYTRVQAMMEKMKKEQAIAWAKKRKDDKIALQKKQKRIEHIKCHAWKYGITTVVCLYLIWLVWAVVQVRIDVYPELGRCLVPKGNAVYDWYNNLKWIDCEVQE